MKNKSNQNVRWIKVNLNKITKEEADKFCGEEKPFPKVSQLVNFAVRKEVDNLQTRRSGY